jgi:hypothetical protein
MEHPMGKTASDTKKTWWDVHIDVNVDPGGYQIYDFYNIMRRCPHVILLILDRHSRLRKKLVVPLKCTMPRVYACYGDGNTVYCRYG